MARVWLHYLWAAHCAHCPSATDAQFSKLLAFGEFQFAASRLEILVHIVHYRPCTTHCNTPSVACEHHCWLVSERLSRFECDRCVCKVCLWFGECISGRCAHWTLGQGILAKGHRAARWCTMQIERKEDRNRVWTRQFRTLYELVEHCVRCPEMATKRCEQCREGSSNKPKFFKSNLGVSCKFLTY